MAEWMEAHLTGLVLYDSRLFNPGHNVSRWANRVAREFEFQATNAAPRNKRANTSSGRPPGFLKGSIRVTTHRVGPKHIQTVLRSAADYMPFVLGGTTGPIVATSANYMVLPRNPGFGTKRRHFTVPGQHANNFLGRAAAATAAHHPSWRGLADLLYQQW